MHPYVSYVFRWDSFSQYILTEVDMRLHYDMMTGMTRMKRSTRWCQGRNSAKNSSKFHVKITSWDLQVTHCEYTEVVTQRATLHSPHFFSHPRTPGWGSLQLPGKRSLPEAMSARKQNLQTSPGSAKEPLPKHDAWQGWWIGSLWMIMKTAISLCHTVSMTSAKGFTDIPCLRLCLALATPACLARNHLHFQAREQDESACQDANSRMGGGTQIWTFSGILKRMANPMKS